MLPKKETKGKVDESLYGKKINKDYHFLPLVMDFAWK
jgi:hypothetical protein